MDPLVMMATIHSAFEEEEEVPMDPIGFGYRPHSLFEMDHHSPILDRLSRNAALISRLFEEQALKENDDVDPAMPGLEPPGPYIANHEVQEYNEDDDDEMPPLVPQHRPDNAAQPGVCFHPSAATRIGYGMTLDEACWVLRDDDKVLSVEPCDWEAPWRGGLKIAVRPHGMDLPPQASCFRMQFAFLQDVDLTLSTTPYRYIEQY
jgi:hypothetical protein